MVEVKGDTARLLSVAERTKALFGKEQADAPAGRRKKKDKQMRLGFVAELEAAEAEGGGWGEKSVSKAGDTVLDRVHQSMILFAAGRGEALRRFTRIEMPGTIWHIRLACFPKKPTRRARVVAGNLYCRPTSVHPGRRQG